MARHGINGGRDIIVVGASAGGVGALTQLAAGFPADLPAAVFLVLHTPPYSTLGAVRHHHERWDGGGYPSGLKGEETPILARLMAVADAYSAMTTDRPYRSGMDKAKALAILREGAGSQWDPECVVAFLNARARHESKATVT